MNADWTPIEEHDSAFLVAALDELSAQLDTAERVRSWPKPGKAPSEVDHLNEAGKQGALSDTRTRLTRLRALMAASPLAISSNTTHGEDFTAHSVPVTEEVIGTALGRYQSSWPEEPAETVVTPELF